MGGFCGPFKFGLLFVYFIVLVLTTSEALKNGFTIRVDAGRMECFFEEIKSNVSLDIEYQVIEGGELNINFYLKLPSGIKLIEDDKKSDEVHTITTTEDGTHEFCFDNSFSTVATKTVFADLGLDFNDHDDETTTFGQGDNLDGVELSSIVESLNRIRGNLERVDHLQSFLKQAKARDYKLVESNKSRVFWWSLIQSFALVGVAVAQVNIVKHFFGGGKHKTRV